MIVIKQSLSLGTLTDDKRRIIFRSRLNVANKAMSSVETPYVSILSPTVSTSNVLKPTESAESDQRLTPFIPEELRTRHWRSNYERRNVRNSKGHARIIHHHDYGGSKHVWTSINYLTAWRNKNVPQMFSPFRLLTETAQTKQLRPAKLLPTGHAMP